MDHDCKAKKLGKRAAPETLNATLIRSQGEGEPVGVDCRDVGPCQRDWCERATSGRLSPTSNHSSTKVTVGPETDTVILINDARIDPVAARNAKRDRLPMNFNAHGQTSARSTGPMKSGSTTEESSETRKERLTEKKVHQQDQ